MSALEGFVLSIIRGLGMVGDALGGHVCWPLNGILGFGLPLWMGKVVVI